MLPLAFVVALWPRLPLASTLLIVRPVDDVRCSSSRAVVENNRGSIVEPMSRYVRPECGPPLASNGLLLGFSSAPGGQSYCFRLKIARWSLTGQRIVSGLFRLPKGWLSSYGVAALREALAAKASRPPGPEISAKGGLAARTGASLDAAMGARVA